MKTAWSITEISSEIKNLVHKLTIWISKNISYFVQNFRAKISFLKQLTTEYMKRNAFFTTNYIMFTRNFSQATPLTNFSIFKQKNFLSRKHYIFQNHFKHTPFYYRKNLKSQKNLFYRSTPDVLQIYSKCTPNILQIYSKCTQFYYRKNL